MFYSMMRFLSVIIVVIATINAPAQTKIIVAVAANMQYTMEALKTEFNKTDKTEIDVVLGASGNLTQQIMQGAPFDIFVSADTSFPQKLAASNFAAEPPKVYAQGLLVLWSAKNNVQPTTDLKLLLTGLLIIQAMITHGLQNILNFIIIMMTINFSIPMAGQMLPSSTMIILSCVKV